MNTNMNPRARERLLIAGGLFKKKTTDLDEIRAKIDAMPDNYRQRLKEMVDWVEEYTNAKMANQK